MEPIEVRRQGRSGRRFCKRDSKLRGAEWPALGRGFDPPIQSSLTSACRHWKRRIPRLAKIKRIACLQPRSILKEEGGQDIELPPSRTLERKLGIPINTPP